VSGLFLPPALRPYASVLGNPNFFVPRLDYYALPAWTDIYDTEPLRHTLAQLVAASKRKGLWVGGPVPFGKRAKRDGRVYSRCRRAKRGGERAAIMYTLIQTATLNGVDPQAWLADVLRHT
jgi:hypothetical protein